MRPLEALHQTIHYALIGEAGRRFPEPGGIVKRMHADTRAALRKLTSDDSLKMWVEWWWEDRDHEAWQRVRKLLTDFDKLILQ